jgi:uncharacterized protein
MADSATPSQDDRTMALLIHILGIFTWFIGPLVVWLIKKDQSAFVDQHGKEQINLQITLTIGYLIGAVLLLVFIGILVIWAVSIAGLVFCILAAIAASQGKEYRFPVNLRLVK